MHKSACARPGFGPVGASKVQADNEKPRAITSITQPLAPVCRAHDGLD